MANKNNYMKNLLIKCNNSHQERTSFFFFTSLSINYRAAKLATNYEEEMKSTWNSLVHERHTESGEMLIGMGV